MWSSGKLIDTLSLLSIWVDSVLTDEVDKTGLGKTDLLIFLACPNFVAETWTFKKGK